MDRARKAAGIRQGLCGIYVRWHDRRWGRYYGAGGNRRGDNGRLRGWVDGRGNCRENARWGGDDRRGYNDRGRWNICRYLFGQRRRFHGGMLLPPPKFRKESEECQQQQDGQKISGPASLVRFGPFRHAGI